MKKTISHYKNHLSALLLVLYCLGCMNAVKDGSDLSQQPQSEIVFKAPKGFRQQIEYFNNRLMSEPENPEINYNLASAYLGIKDFRKAYSSIKYAIKYSKSNRDTNKYNIFYRKLEADAYKYSVHKNNIDDYEMFLELYYSSRYYDDILVKLEELMYNEAVSKNSAELLDAFAKRFSNSLHMKEVLNLLDEIAFQEALKVNTVSKYQEFLQNNKFSNYKEDALEKIDRLRFEDVSIIDTIEAYGGFIQKYPANKYIKKAKDRISNLKFAMIEAGNADPIRKYDDYIESNPQGAFVDVSLAKIDLLRYEKAKSFETIEALEEFIENNPDSSYVDRAIKRVDVLRYEKVEEADTIQAYETFLADYPKSRFKYDAKARLETLQKAKKIGDLCFMGEAKFNAGEYEEAASIYKKALSIDYSSRAHFSLGSIYEIIGDTEQDYTKKIDYYYKATTAYTVVLRRAPKFNNISSVLEKLVEKRSAEQRIMNNAMARRQSLPEPFKARLIKYSKAPVLIFSNANREDNILIEVEYEFDDYVMRLNILPLTEIKKTFSSGNIYLTVKGSNTEEEYALSLYPYYEYRLRVK